MSSAVLLTPEMVKQKYPVIYEVFFASTRQEGESLHDYFTRKKMKCFCPNCRKLKQQALV